MEKRSDENIRVFVHRPSLSFRLTQLFIICLFALVACFATTSLSFGASAKTLNIRTLAESGEDTEALRPTMYFNPDYFGSDSTLYPSDGSQYVAGGKAKNNTQTERGPHGGYATTTSKCGVCHAVHSAEGSSSLTDNHLLRQRATGCEYCHLSGSILGAAAQSNKIVYTGTPSKDSETSDLDTSSNPKRSGHAITGKSVSIPASDIESFTLSCASCHSVHGSAASAWRPEDFWGSEGIYKNDENTEKYGYKLLRANPSGTGSATLTHAPSPLSSAATDTAALNQYTLSVWCANCHDKAYPTDNSLLSKDTTFQALSLPTTATHTTKEIAQDISGPHQTLYQGIYSGSFQCYTCHRGGGLSAVPLGASGQSAERLKDLGYSNPQALIPSSDSQGSVYAGNAYKTCSPCHYGSADYATDSGRIEGDWPHSSSDDLALLGNFSFETSPVTSVSATLPAGDTLTSANKTSAVCGRCHLPDADNTPSLLRRSAHWQKVSFDTQGGSVSIPSFTYVRSGAPYGELATTTRVGRDFKGWYTKPNEEGSRITSATVATTTSDQTLYAAWESVKYRVSYNANGATSGTDVEDNRLYAGGTEATAAVNTWENLGMDFVEWNTLSGGTGDAYQPGDTIAIEDTDIILYAIWEKQALSFKVTVTSSDLSFRLPVSGYSVSGDGSAVVSYAWNINWGDGQNTTPSGSSSADDTTIPSHTYPSAGTYTIKITPQGTPTSGWARAFGFRATGAGPHVQTNKNKVTAVLQIPTLGFLASTTSTGDHFLRDTWVGCSNLTSVTFNDSTDWSSITTVGTYFLRNTWNGCSSLQNAAVPDTSTWQVTGNIGTYFLSYTWNGCSALTTATVPDTSGWGPTSLGTYFLTYAWSSCSALTTATVLDTSGWQVTSIGTDFLSHTWENCTKLDDISFCKLSDSFKDTSGFYTNSGNFVSTFGLNIGNSTYSDYPSFYTRGLITDVPSLPAGYRSTFARRTGLPNYNSLPNYWKPSP
jgi:uncharacterized repeat protein (TIGR02543 family)